MNSKHITVRNHFNDLLVGMEREHGTRDTCIQFLEALQAALRATAFKGGGDLRRQFEDFYDLFAPLKPRMAIIQHYLDVLIEHLDENPRADAGGLIEEMIAAIHDARADNAAQNAKLLKEAVKLIPSCGRVLVHSHSRTVLDTLDLARRTHKKFEVIVAEQETARTLDVVRFLQERDIRFIVVPEYMLSSLEVDISCLLIGAVTLKHDMHFVVDAGTKAVVSEMRLAKIPVQLMLTTNKFSYWNTRKASQTVKTIKSIAHPHADFCFDRVKFSHDRLPLDLVDRIVTEEGGFPPDRMREVYRRKLADYRALHARLALRHDGADR